MFDLVVHGDATEAELLRHILKGLHRMSLDLTMLNAAVARNTTAVDALVATHNKTVETLVATDTAAKAAVDLAVAAVDASAAKAEAAVLPPVAPPA